MTLIFLISGLPSLSEAMSAPLENAIIVNGLVDAQARSDYLPSFLRSATLPGATDADITLLDYRGRPLLEGGPSVEWAASAYKDDQAIISWGGHQLRLAAPVRFNGRP